MSLESWACNGIFIMVCVLVHFSPHPDTHPFFTSHFHSHTHTHTVPYPYYFPFQVLKLFCCLLHFRRVGPLRSIAVSWVCVCMWVCVRVWKKRQLNLNATTTTNYMGRSASKTETCNTLNSMPIVEYSLPINQNLYLSLEKYNT